MTTAANDRAGWAPATMAMFLAFAFAYFLSTLLRAITATIAPTISAELSLSAGDLGLLAGAYFLGFSFTQLPLGSALDRHGPRKVAMVLLSLAAVACLWFAVAGSLTTLVGARLLIGVGVSACLMAPLTAYRLCLPAHQQLRANAWMLMTGSLGMLTSTLPVHWLMPWTGWRGIFVGVAALIVVAIALIARWGPKVQPSVPKVPSTDASPARVIGYREIFLHPRFVQLIPAGLFIYGGMVAMQSLWAGPWLTQVSGFDAHRAAQGLFAINLTMLCTFFAWGMVTPRMAARGIDSHAVMRWGMLLPLVMIVAIVAQGTHAGVASWAVWCMASSVITLSQPLLAQEFPASAAGRALSAYNLVLFIGIFVVQWGIGVAIDGLVAAGWARVDAFQGAFAIFAACCFVAYGWYLWCERGIERRRMATAIDNPS